MNQKLIIILGLTLILLLALGCTSPLNNDTPNPTNNDNTTPNLPDNTDNTNGGSGNVVTQPDNTDNTNGGSGNVVTQPDNTDNINGGSETEGVYFSVPSYSATDGGTTVTDSANGFVWQASSYGAGDTLSWQDAMDYCTNNTAGLAGTGWRLPNKYEIRLLFNDYTSSSMYGSPFSNNISFWSSTTVPSNTSYAYSLDSGSGSISLANKTNASYLGARCVRSE